MEHIDWIVSFIIFVFVILIVILTIPKFLPEARLNSDVQTPQLILSDLKENIKVYNIFTNNEDKDIFFLKIDQTNGKLTSSYVLDSNILYGTILKNTKFFNYDANYYKIKTKTFQENFYDTSNLKNITLISGNIINFDGDSFIFENSKFETKENFSNIYGEFVFEPVDINLYFNYEDENNFSKCRLEGNNLSLYDTNLDGSFNISSEIIDLNLNWATLNFQSNFKGHAFCEIGEVKIENNSQTSINNGKIIVENKEGYYVSRLNLFYDNYLKEENDEIETSYLNYKVDNTKIEVNFFKENRVDLGKIDFLFEDNITYEVLENKPIIFKDTEENHKLIGFPNTKAFFIKVLEEDEIEINLNNNFKINGLDYEIEFLEEEYFIWTLVDINASESLELYLKKVEGYDPLNSFSKDHTSENHPDITVEEISNDWFKINVENNSLIDLEGYEIKIPNNLINVSSLDDSLLIYTSNLIEENTLTLKNKENPIYILLNFYKLENNRASDCFIDVKDNGFFIKNCSQDTVIKVNILEEIKEIPNISYYVDRESIITYEKIKNLESIIPNYYINIYNDIENIEFGNYGFIGDFQIFERSAKYLNKNGNLEIVKVLIKPN